MCGGGKTQQTTSATTSDLPDYMKPYVQRNLARGEAEANKPYEAYTGQRIAAVDPNTTASRQGLLDISGTGISGLADAQNYTRQGIDAAANLGDYSTGNFTQANYSDPTKFTGSNVTDYMSPYMQNVIDVNKNNAILDYDRLRGSREAQAANAGAFGGSRRFVQEGMDQEALLRNLSGLQATGMQQAYDSGMGQFNADRNAQTGIEQNRAAELSRVQSGTEASRQFGAGQGLAALQAGQGLVGDLTQQGELERQTAIQNAQLQDTVGSANSADAQRQIDLNYQNWLDQQNYGRDAVNFMTSQVSGQPQPTNSTTVGTTPAPSGASQLLGAGLSGLSLYKAYTA
tara:strand:- start:293 stop:1321 length:1029 start_codon:yes stop_codon:yes gene_type:complete